MRIEWNDVRMLAAEMAESVREGEREQKKAEIGANTRLVYGMLLVKGENQYRC